MARSRACRHAIGQLAVAQAVHYYCTRSGSAAVDRGRSNIHAALRAALAHCAAYAYALSGLRVDVDVASGSGSAGRG